VLVAEHVSHVRGGGVRAESPSVMLTDFTKVTLTFVVLVWAM